MSVIAGESSGESPAGNPTDVNVRREPENVPWTEYALQQAQIAQKTIESTVENAIETTRSRVDRILTTSSAHLNQTIDSLQELKSEYSTYEDIAFGKIKEGFLLAYSHPLITTGAIVGVGVLGLKKTRKFLSYKTMRIFLSEETMLSRADTKVKELRQSMELLKGESEKLEVSHPIGGNSNLLRDEWARKHALAYLSPFQLSASAGQHMSRSCFARSFASQVSEPKKSETRKEVSTVEDPFDSPTYNIPEKPVTFTEGASYTLVILAGLGIAGAAAYAVCKELIFEPKEYQIFNKTLERVQSDSQVRVRIGSPITGYGSESRNRAARQRVPNKTWIDDDGVEHVLVNFHIRGPHGAGRVYSEMFKDKVDKEWKFTYLIVEVTSPSPTQLMLESYIPA